MKTKITIILTGLLLFECVSNIHAQNWLTAGNGLTGGTPSTPNEWLGSNNLYDLIIKTNNLQRMRITSGGGVLIGSGTTANYPFRVDGYTNAGTLSSGGNFAASIYSSTGGALIGGQDTGNNNAVFGAAGSSSDILFATYNGSSFNERMCIKNNGGYVGVGTTAPKDKFFVHVATDQNWGIMSYSGPQFEAVNDARTAYVTGAIEANPLIINYLSGGKVGIGTTSPLFKLQVNGIIRTTNDTAYKPTGGAWTTYSDQRLKKDIASFKDGLAVLRKVNPVTFKFNGIGDLSTAETHIGVIAQDIKPVAPYCVGTGTARLVVKQSEAQNFSGSEIIATLPPDSTGEAHTIVSPLCYNYDGLIYVMVNSIKQLDSVNTVLAKKDSIKDMKLQILQNQDSVNTLKIQTLQNKDLLNTVLLQAMQNQMNQLDSLINSCCSQKSTRSMQLNSNSQSSINSKDVELSNSNIVVLDQNVPNPFAEQTSINYFLPDNVTHAQIIFLDQSGKLIKAVDLTDKGKGTLNVFANDLSNGSYTYSLIVDGQTIETKKMVKSK